MVFNLAAFYNEFTNLQISQTQFRNGAFVPVLQNAPKADIYGIEGDISLELFENFNLRAGATWLHARYKDFIYGGLAVSPLNTVGATGCPSARGCGGIGINSNADPLKTYLNVNALQDLCGKQLVRSPDFSGFVGFDYLVPMGDGGIKLSANLKYTDDYIPSNPSLWGGTVQLADGSLSTNDALAGTPFADRAGDQRFSIDGYVLVNASITYTGPSDTYYLRLWGNNLTNEKYPSHYSGTTSFGSYINQAEPLTYGVTFGAKFGR